MNHYDEYDICDEEKCWDLWRSNNKELIEKLNNLDLAKQIYMFGFSDGYMYKQRVNAREYLQK